jgi:hypothetical protein
MIGVILEVVPERGKEQIVIDLLNQHREVKQVGYYSGPTNEVFAMMTFASEKAAGEWYNRVIGSGSPHLPGANKVIMRFKLNPKKKS